MLSIGELAQRSGLAPSALRYYERIGLLPADAMRGGTRYYRPRAERLLEVIGYCKQAGFSLDEIAALLHGAGNWPELARRKRQALEEQIQRLEQARALIDEALRRGCTNIKSCAGLEK